MTNPGPSAGIERRIFIVGVPRSGTTLVQSLLAAHSDMTSFTESHFFDRHFTHLPGPRRIPALSRPILTRDPVPRLREFLAENKEDPPAAAQWFEGGGPLRGRPLVPFQTLPVARQLLRVLDELALARGKRGWIEKTPRHLRYLPFLERVSGSEPHPAGVPGPRTDFIHMIRDGLETVASLHEASKSWEKAYDLETCVRRWNEDVKFSLDRVGSSRDHFVFYEELTAQPEAALRELFSSLGLDWQPNILEEYAGTSDGLITGQEIWKANVGRSIHRSATSDRVLTAEQRQQVTESLHHDLYGQLREGLGRPLEIRPSAETVIESGDDLPCISVVVPFFNSESHIASCIDSLLGQEDIGGAFEIILINNRSADGSAAVVAGYEQLVVLEEATPGAYAARNTGLGSARAPLIAFTDADCVVDRHWLRSIRQGMENSKVAILLGHCRYPAEASLALRMLGAYENAKTQYVANHCARAHHFAYANNMAVRASVFHELGPFKEWKRAADSELVHRLAARRPDLGLAFRPSMQVTHMEFLQARQRAGRLSLYTQTNSKIETFRELGLGQRLGLLLHLLKGHGRRAKKIS